MVGVDPLALIATGKEILSYVSLGIDLKNVISDYVKSNRTMGALVNRAVNQARRDANIDSQHYYGKPLNDEMLKDVLLDLVQKKATNELKDVEIPNWLGKNDFEKFYDSMMQDVGFWNYLHQQIESRQHLLQLGMLAESEQLLKKIEAQIEILSQHSSKLPEWLRPYEKELSVDVEKSFLDDASENLIRDGKLLLNQSFINKVKQYLDEKSFCLIKAPEGRGKTYLSRIIAYDYHHNRGMEVYFLDIKECNGISVSSIDDVLQGWHKNNAKEYLLVIENVHAYNELEALRKLINQWIRTSGNHVWFLLNTRPTYVELDNFSDWEEQVELNPDGEDVNGIINLYSKEVGRVPFANDEERGDFVEKICPNKKKASGANLRLLKIYLETWQYHPEIQYISGVKEQTVIERFRNLYLRNRSSDEIKALWYISSLFQFDVPVHEDFVQDVGNLVADGLLRFEENRYHLPHSVDAFFLYKAICGYKHKNVVSQMKTFATCFVNDILVSDCPKDFENEFRLLVSGLNEKDEFKGVIRCLTREDLAERIMKDLNPGFVLWYFHPENHENPDPEALVEYYKKNIECLKPVILGLEPGPLNLLNKVFKKHLKYNVFADFFKDLNELGKYLIVNYRIFQKPGVIIDISKLGAEHKNFLRKYYDANINLLKPCFFELPCGGLSFAHKTFKNYLDYNIIKDIFEDPKDLDDYLNVNYKVLIYEELLILFGRLDGEHKTVLFKHYEKNKDLLKHSLLGFSAIRLFYIYKAFKKYWNYNIVKDIFENLDDLDKYLNINYKILQFYYIINAISILGIRYKDVLKKHYVSNINLLKPFFNKMHPVTLRFACNSYKKHLNINVIKDIFETPEDLDGYLSANCYKVFFHCRLITSICRLDDGHKTVLIEHYKKNKALLKPLLLKLSPIKFRCICYAFSNYLDYNIVKDIFVDPKDLDVYLRGYGVKRFVQDYGKVISELSDEHIQLFDRYNALGQLFYTAKNGFCIKKGYIDMRWRNKVTFDVSSIKNNKFYFEGVSWAYIQKFVYVIKRDMTEETRQQSVDMVEAIIRIVLAKENALSYATANDLAYFYANVTSVDETIGRKLMEESSVRADVENRLTAPSYTVGDLYLFDLFFSQLWCKAILEPRIINADDEQKEVIKIWYDEFKKKKKRGEKKNLSGTLLDYIYQKYYPTENPPTDAPLVGGV